MQSVDCTVYALTNLHTVQLSTRLRKQHRQRLSIILLGIHTGSTVIHRVGGEIALSIALTSGPQHLIPCIRPYFHHATFSLQTGLSLTDPRALPVRKDEVSVITRIRDVLACSLLGQAARLSLMTRPAYFLHDDVIPRSHGALHLRLPCPRVPEACSEYRVAQ